MNSKAFFHGRSVRAISQESSTPITSAIDWRTTASDTVFHSAWRIDGSLKARRQPARP